jgi:hypothetical protein
MILSVAPAAYARCVCTVRENDEGHLSNMVVIAVESPPNPTVTSYALPPIAGRSFPQRPLQVH